MVHVIFLLVVILSATKLKTSGGNVRFYGIAFSVLFLFAALRYQYGNDYYSYYRHFERIHLGFSSPYKHEFLFTLLNKALPNFYVLIALTSFLFVLALYLLLKHHLPANVRWIGVLILLINPYLFLMNLSAIRQCMAMILFFIAVRAAFQRKPILYAAFIIAAALFHKSAWILLPLYFIINDHKVSRSTMIISAFLLFIMLRFDFLDRFLIDPIVSLFKDKNYAFYFSSDVHNSLRSTLLTSVFLVYVLLNINRLEGIQIAYGKLYLIGLVLAVLAFKASMLTRPQMYFDIFSIVVLPLLFSSQKRDEDTSQRSGYQKIFRLINGFVLPAMIICIYFLRYYSFFTNPLWHPFWVYHTIL